MGLTRTLRKSLARCARRLVELEDPTVYDSHPLVTASCIEHPGLVSRAAVVRNSVLTGHVKVADGAKIIDARLAGPVSIGKWTTFNGPNSDVFAMVHQVSIGNFCSIARNVSIQEYDHRYDGITSYFIHANVFGTEDKSQVTSKGGITIGSDVWIGTQSVIISGAQIDTGAVIGANSVVNSHIPPYAIAVGSPAKVKEFRFPPEIVERLLSLEWWTWDIDRLRKNAHLFEGRLTESELATVV